MKKITEQEFNERYEALPEVLQDALYSIDTKAAVREVATAQRLHIDQAAKLDYAVALVMLGFTPTEDFAKEIEQELAIPKETALSVTALINEKVFLPIRDYLKKGGTMHEAPQPVATLNTAKPSEESFDRASMLKEIETPTPAIPALVVPYSTPQKTKAATGVPEGASKGALVSTTTDTKAPAPRDMVANKLMSPTSTTTEQVVVGRDRSSYKSDPYREPIE